MPCLENFAEKALNGFAITFGTQHKVERVARTVHRSIQIFPRPLDLYVRFIHSLLSRSLVADEDESGGLILGRTLTPTD